MQLSTFLALSATSVITIWAAPAPQGTTTLAAPEPTTSLNPDGIPCPGIDCYTYLVGEITPWPTRLIWDPA